MSGKLENCRAPSAGDEAPGRDAADGYENRPALVEEIEVEREAHAEGVDARAARDQQAGAGLLAVEVRQAEQASSEALGDPDLATEDPRPR
jgi:hypothetical protein